MVAVELLCFQSKRDPVFAVYSLMVILIEKKLKNTEMNLDIDCAIRIFFSLKYELLYRLGFDGTSGRFCFSTLNQSPSVPYRYDQ